MTAQRQERNGWRPGIAFIGLLAGLGVLAGPDFAARASTTEQVIVNRYTGLANEGYDPVAYFTDALAERGLPGFEASEAGAVWRFRNEGNRASFVAHPEIYGPQFGGYDPIERSRLRAAVLEPTRCEFANDVDQACRSDAPVWHRVGDEHVVRCHLYRPRADVARRALTVEAAPATPEPTTKDWIER